MPWLCKTHSLVFFKKEEKLTMDIMDRVISILPGMIISSIFAVLVANGILYAVLRRRERKLMEVIRKGLLDNGED